MKVKKDHCSNFPISAIGKKKPEKINTGIVEVTGSNPVEALPHHLVNIFLEV